MRLATMAVARRIRKLTLIEGKRLINKRLEPASPYVLIATRSHVLLAAWPTAPYRKDAFGGVWVKLRGLQTSHNLTFVLVSRRAPLQRLSWQTLCVPLKCCEKT